MNGNIASELRAFERRLNEKIEAIVVGKHYFDAGSDNDRRPPKQRDVILSREKGLKLLNENYDSGYGGAYCFPMYAWSANHFFTVSEYDGATGVAAWPRHPVDCKPEFD